MNAPASIRAIPVKLGIGRRWAFALAAWILSCVVATLAGCPQSKVPARDEARGVVLVIAKGVALADQACANWGMGEVTSGDPARMLRARDVLGKCSHEAHAATTWLTFAESSIDTWDAATIGTVGCLVNAAVPNVRALFGVLETIGVALSPAMADATNAALGLVPLAAPSCAVTVPVSTVDAGVTDAPPEVYPLIPADAADGG